MFYLTPITLTRQGTQTYEDWACASSQFAFPRKRLTSAPQRDHKQPVKCLSQR